MKSILILLFLQISVLSFSQKLQINSFRVLETDSTYTVTKPIKIDYKPKHLAIFFTDSVGAQLECRLLNSDNVKWVKLKELRYMTYSNLFGGEYEFQVKNTATKEQKSLKFSIEPAFWQKWWFIPTVFLYLVFIIGLIIYIFFNYRFRQQTKLQRIRNEIAADLHDDVGATLSSIALSSNLINRKIGREYPELQKMLAQIKIDSEDTIHTIRDTVWTINPENDSFEKLIEKLRAFGFQIFSAKEIEFTFDNKLENLKSPKLTMEQRRNAYLILREAINNIAKHANASIVIMNIDKDKEGIRITIKDNGKGFDIMTISEGNGLKNFEKRAQKEFMDFKITTEIGEGTQVTILIPEL